MVLLAPVRSFAQTVVTSTASSDVRVYDASGQRIGTRPAQDLLGRPVQAFTGGLPLLLVQTSTGPILVQRAAVGTNAPIAPPSVTCMAMTAQPGNIQSAGTNGIGRTCSDVSHAR